jgi:multiple sugar transport system ATP-binding protein
MRVRVSDAISLPVPAAHAARCRSAAGRDLILGLRPEHLTEPRRSERDDGGAFDVMLDVVEPLGMETMVFFNVNGNEICGRVDPGSARGPGESMRLAANVEHMHLIDPATDAVL